MEIRKPEIKAMKYEDFNDNEYLEKMAAELRREGTNVIVGCLDELIEWGRSNSLWPLTFATSCCGIEFMAVGAARYDFARFGFEVARASPRQADFIMVAGMSLSANDWRGALSCQGRLYRNPATNKTLCASLIIGALFTIFCSS